MAVSERSEVAKEANSFPVLEATIEIHE